MNDIIKLGISSCLLGTCVRYDGGHRLDPCLNDTLGRCITWLPVCPEVEAGMPVPRDPMQITKVKGSTRLITIKTGQDKTSVLSRWSRGKLKQLESAGISGFVFKARSPSCGVYDTGIHDPSGRVIGKGMGLFAAAVAARWPHLPIEDEGRLQQAGNRENFIERVFVYQQWMDFFAKKGGVGDLATFHARHKLLLMSHSIRHLRELGSLVANARQHKRAELFERYVRILMDGLKLQATMKKHTNVLQHIAGYFKNRLSGEEKKTLHEIIARYHKGLVPLIVPITVINQLIRKYHEPYLQQQCYLMPHPLELMLRNHA